MASYSLEDLREAMRKVLNQRGINPNVLDLGSSHPYSCTCKTCWKWWKQMGLGDEEYPPFTQAQLDAATYEEAQALRTEPPFGWYGGEL